MILVSHFASFQFSSSVCHCWSPSRAGAITYTGQCVDSVVPCESSTSYYSYSPEGWIFSAVTVTKEELHKYVLAMLGVLPESVNMFVDVTGIVETVLRSHLGGAIKVRHSHCMNSMEFLLFIVI